MFQGDRRRNSKQSITNEEDRNANVKKYISKHSIKINKLSKSKSHEGYMTQRYISQLRESNNKLILLKTLKDIDYNKPKTTSEHALYSPQPRIHEHSKHFS